MLLTFRQGIVRAGTNYLTSTGAGVNLRLTDNDPLELAFANGTHNYYHVESGNVNKAWPIAPSANPKWLYIDIDPITAERTFGATDYEFVVAGTAPSTPADGQHWFDTTTNTMKVYVTASSAFVVRNRVFIAQYKNGAFSYYPVNTSQVGLSASAPIFATGRIVYDNTGKAIRTSDGSFLTTESDFFSSGSIAQGTRLESNVVYARAAENIPAYHVVKFSNYGNGNYGEIVLAEYADVGEETIGITTRDMLIGDIDSIIIQGAVTNVSWDWEVEGLPIGTKLYIGVDAEKGTLVYPDPHEVEPARVQQPPVARVLSKTSVIFEQGLGGIGDPGPQGPPGANTDPATDVIIGAVRLSVPAATEEDPIAVGDNDPRMSNARPPTAHTHDAVDVRTTSFGPYGISNVQTILESIQSGKLDLTGGTLTGVLVLDGDPVDPLGAATKQYVDSTISSLAVLKTGSTMTGYLTLSADPIIDEHAATKRYVDNIVGSGGTVPWILVDNGADSPYVPYDASVNEYILVDTTAGEIVINLPASPSFNGKITIVPVYPTYTTNKLTITRNGNLISGVADDIEVTTDGMAVILIWRGGSVGWVVTE